jgi:hypothetical protein
VPQCPSASLPSPAPTYIVMLQTRRDVIHHQVLSRNRQEQGALQARAPI